MVPEWAAGGSVDRVLVVIRDVTERKAAEEELTRKTLHDPLTGLPNRVLLLDRVGLALDRLGRTGGVVAVLFLDLDRFKDVNDTLGHAAGDRLLVEVGKRLSTASRPGDTVARLAGDEFVVVCGELGTEHDAAIVARRLDLALGAPFDYRGRIVSITASTGIATSSTPRCDPRDLVGDADAAMYRAKRNGRARYEFFEAGRGARRSVADRETALAERTERVVAVEAGEHVPRLLGPRHRIGRGDTPDNLGVAALVDPVLGPAPRVVLRARDLHERHVTCSAEPPDPVAVRVPGEVSDDVLATGDDLGERLAVVGVDPEVRPPTGDLRRGSTRGGARRRAPVPRPIPPARRAR